MNPHAFSIWLGAAGTFFCLSLFFNSANAAAFTTTIPQAASVNNPTQENSQDQMAGWMIEASQVAKDYVEGLDKGQYSASWNKGDALFQRTISQKEWVTALNLARKRLGNVKSRSMKDQKPAWDPHGLPKGPYMVVEYNTSFDRAPGSGELLTLRRGSDGVWRVLTYQVN